MIEPVFYLYRCFDREGQLLYAGITDDVERRKREHAVAAGGALSGC